MSRADHHARLSSWARPLAWSTLALVLLCTWLDFARLDHLDHRSAYRHGQLDPVETILVNLGFVGTLLLYALLGVLPLLLVATRRPRESMLTAVLGAALLLTLSARAAQLEYDWLVTWTQRCSFLS